MVIVGFLWWVCELIDLVLFWLFSCIIEVCSRFLISLSIWFCFFNIVLFCLVISSWWKGSVSGRLVMVL